MRGQEPRTRRSSVRCPRTSSLETQNKGVCLARALPHLPLLSARLHQGTINSGSASPRLVEGGVGGSRTSTRSAKQQAADSWGCVVDGREVNRSSVRPWLNEQNRRAR